MIVLSTSPLLLSILPFTGRTALCTTVHCSLMLLGSWSKQISWYTSEETHLVAEVYLMVKEQKFSYLKETLRLAFLWMKHTLHWQSYMGWGGELGSNPIQLPVLGYPQCSPVEREWMQQRPHWHGCTSARKLDRI